MPRWLTSAVMPAPTWVPRALLALLVALAVALAGSPAAAQQDLEVSVTVTPSPASLPDGGGDVEFTVAITNDDDETVFVWGLEDSVYGELLMPDGDTTATDISCATAFPNPDWPEIEPGETFECTYTGAVSETQTNEVTAVVSQWNDEKVDRSGEATVTVSGPPADLVLEKSVDAAEITVGDEATFTITVTNDGPGVAEDVTVTDTVPDAFDLISATTDTGTCEVAGQTVTCDLGTLAVDASAEIAILVEAVEAGEFTNVAVVTSSTDDPDEDNNTDDADVDVSDPPAGPSADLSVVKTVDASEIAVGEEASYTITVTNNGPDAAEDVTVTDTVPDTLDIISATTDTGTCEVSDQTVTCDLGTLAVDDTVAITVTVEATAEGEFTNLATVTSSTPDPDPDNNDSSTTITVDRIPVAGCPELVDTGTTVIAGLTRIETAIQGSQAIFDDADCQAGAVVLTRSDLFPDAQAGAPLAIARNAPMLLSEPAELNALTEAEIIRVLPPGGTVYLLGGTVALSDAVEDRIEELGFVGVRYGGQNRFGTAAIISDEGLDNPATLLVANGGNFPDSVLAGSASNSGGLGALAAVLLTSDSDVPPETAAYLATRDDDPTLITIGGPAAGAYPDVESVMGDTRFATSVAVAERFFDEPTIVGLATGLDFADALTGGAIIGRGTVGPGPMLLVETSELPAVISGYLTENASTVTRAVVFGGVNAINQSVVDGLDGLLGFE